MPKQVTEDVEPPVAVPEPEVASDGMSIQEMTARTPRRPAPPPKPKRKVNWLGWLLFIVILGGIGAGGFYGRDYVVKFVPASAKLYQMLKIDVKIANELGVEIRDVTSKSVLKNGVLKLTVSGNIVNVTGTERPVPRISIQLVDKNGQHVYSWSAAADQGRVEPWGTVTFSSSMNQPPEDAKHVRVDAIVPPKPDNTKDQ